MSVEQSRRLMVWQLCIFGSIATLGLAAAVTSIGPTVLGGSRQAAADLRPFGVVALAALLSGLYLGIVFVRTPEALPGTKSFLWVFGWIGAVALLFVLGAWVYQAISGDPIGIGPNDPPELNPFGGPLEPDVQYQLTISSLGLPLLVPWAQLLWEKRRCKRSNPSLERP